MTPELRRFIDETGALLLIEDDTDGRHTALIQDPRGGLMTLVGHMPGADDERCFCLSMYVEPDVKFPVKTLEELRETHERLWSGCLKTIFADGYVELEDTGHEVVAGEFRRYTDGELTSTLVACDDLVSDGAMQRELLTDEDPGRPGDLDLEKLLRANEGIRRMVIAEMTARSGRGRLH